LDSSTLEAFLIKEKRLPEGNILIPWVLGVADSRRTQSKENKLFTWALSKRSLGSLILVVPKFSMLDKRVRDQTDLVIKLGSDI
jgi:hypothetical protein